MIPTVQQNEDRRERTRYTLTNTEHGHDWGSCAEVEGLFGEPWRETYELFGWVPEGTEVRGWVGRRVCLVPENGMLDAWLLEDAESLGPHPGTDSLVLTGLDDYEGPPEGYRGPVRLHDGRRWLGSCREFARILPPARVDPPLVLRGLAPADELRRALMTATRRPLDLGEASLNIRDDKGEPFAELPLWVTITAWHPSPRGAGLIDLELEGKLSSPAPAHAQPVWERWLTGPPRTPGGWVDLDTRQRWAWLDHVRERACLRTLHDRPSGHAYELDGRHMTDVPGLYLALGEAVNGPGGYFGGCLDALVDCLRGDFGYTAPSTLLWRDPATAHEHLSHVLTPDGESYDLVATALDILGEGGMRVTFR
ncbi:barstar family protein [Streptomyces sp. NPDC088762]|uniref:barstar family protein n=1 Tax=Streptomyces sp. NPDC088762 TaxID=3365891 RepID=UPI00380E3A45